MWAYKKLNSENSKQADQIKLFFVYQLRIYHIKREMLIIVHQLRIFRKKRKKIRQKYCISAFLMHVSVTLSFEFFTGYKSKVHNIVY